MIPSSILMSLATLSSRTDVIVGTGMERPGLADERRTSLIQRSTA